MNNIICARNKTPETCMICKEEGYDYCEICADNCAEPNTEVEAPIDYFFIATSEQSFTSNNPFIKFK